MMLLEVNIVPTIIAILHGILSVILPQSLLLLCKAQKFIQFHNKENRSKANEWMHMCKYRRHIDECDYLDDN